MVDTPLYRVTGLIPRADISLGRYGFGIHLDSKFAKRTLDKREMSRTQERISQNFKTDILERLFPKDKKWLLPPFHFVEDSLLVQSIHVPGDACDLGIDWSDIDELKREQPYRTLTYGPHNVDSMQQAYGLLTLFTEWINIAEALTHEEK